jgi:predicted RNA-binding protein with PUA-like domain
MAYWLVKTEPEEFSWDDQVKRGAKGEVWSGVRNFTARRHLKEMKKGDLAFFYHTGDEKQVVGIAEVAKATPLDTVAILPFENLSTDPEAGYLGDDVAYSLTDNLARLRDLKVRPYSSTSRYKPGTDARTAS